MEVRIGGESLESAPVRTRSPSERRLRLDSKTIANCVPESARPSAPINECRGPAAAVAVAVFGGRHLVFVEEQ